MKINPKAKLNTKQVKDIRLSSVDKTKGMGEKLTRVVKEQVKSKPRPSEQAMREKRQRREVENAKRKNREYHINETARNGPAVAKAKGKAQRNM